MATIYVGIVDDHKLFRDGVAELINGFTDYQVIIEADNGIDLMAQLQKAKQLPDIILLDINMKEMDGFETAEWLKQNHPDIKILALSMYENETAVIRMLRAGARGYILKNIRKDELQQALTSIITRGYYYTDLVTGKLIHIIHTFDEPKTAAEINNLVSLTPREIEFLKLACTELPYKSIAQKMTLSIHTIDGYRDTLFEKLNVHSRVGLVLYAIKNKIVLVE